MNDAIDTIIEEISRRTAIMDEKPKPMPPPGATTRASITPPPKSDAPASKSPARAGRKANEVASSTSRLPSESIGPTSPASEAKRTTSTTTVAPRSRKSAREGGGGGSHRTNDTQVPFAPSADITHIENPESYRSGHKTRDDQRLAAAAIADGNGRRGQSGGDAPFKDAPPPADIAVIVQLWRLRQRWHRAEKALILQAKAVCRAWTDGDKIEAGKLFDKIADGDSTNPELTAALDPFLMAISIFEPQRAAIEKRLRKMAEALEIWRWAKDVKGFGALNLAAIVGECGEVGSYRNPSCVWKRMGLAVIDGGRQRRVADAEAALKHGYDPTRRAVAYLLGDCLIKNNKNGSGDESEPLKYRALYLERKEVEAAKPEVKSKAHAHNRAARYMTKRVLRDLWAAWRKE
jgi:hypothetical protein